MEAFVLNTFAIVALCSAAVVLLVTLIYFGRLVYYNDNGSDKQSDTIAVSVIVVAKNELENLKKLIPVILNQSYSNFELVVVDDHSWDGTYDYLNSLKENEPKLQFVALDDFVEMKQGKKFALTLGIKRAKNPYLLLTDADCLPASDDWIKNIVNSFDNKEFVLGYSPYTSNKKWFMPIIAFETFWVAWQYFSMALLGAPYMGVGRNLAYKKEVFTRHSGFKSHLSIAYGDDDLFVQEAANSKNVNISLNPSAHVYTYPKESLELWLRQKKRHLSAGKMYKFRYKFILNFVWLIWPVYFATTISYFAMANYSYGVIIALILPLVLLWSFAIAISIKYKMYKSWWAFPLMLFIHQIFVYPLLGLYTLFAKKELKW